MWRRDRYIRSGERYDASKTARESSACVSDVLCARGVSLGFREPDNAVGGDARPACVHGRAANVSRGFAGREGKMKLAKTH